jgi:pilus assembly protein Flp/PilA
MTDAFTWVVVRVQNAIADLRDREEGQALVEYALILALVSVAAIGALKILGGKVTGVFDSINSALP